MDTTEQFILDDDSRQDSGRSQKSSGGGGFSLLPTIPFIGAIRNNLSHSPEQEKRRDRTTVQSNNNNKDKDNHGSGYSNNRYDHDVKQAKMMRQGMQKRKQLKEITEADIELAFEGLETSETLRQEGKLSEALKISELSIELLIQFLKSDARTTLPNVSRDMVGELPFPNH
ncbi:MAG: hypothetical protein SGARI_002442 [Bacillariaceae sp.]